MGAELFAVGMGLVASVLIGRDLWQVYHIPQLPAVPEAAATPSVSVIIPARNEEQTIRRSVGGVLAQRYPNFRLTVLNDHSSDATGAILASLQDDPRLAVMDGADLPEGWVGKCWACWQAAQATQSEWLLFLDADTEPQPELIATAIYYADQEQLDLLTLMPFLELGSFWERTILPAFLSIIEAAFPLRRINDPDSDVVLANGQCLLLRRSAYERAGGHAAVRDRVLEDVELAQAVVRAGGRLRVVDGRHLLRVRMYTNGAEVREGLTKNAIAGLQNGGGRSAWAGVRQVIVALTPPALIIGTIWAALRGWSRPAQRLIRRTTLLVNLLAGWSWITIMRRLYRQPAWTALLFPLGLICYLLIAADAARRIWRGQGVRWKGRTYQR